MRGPDDVIDEAGLRLSSNSRPGKPVRLVRGEGAAVWDAAGRRYVDLSSQTMNLLFGQCHPRINAAIAQQLGTLTFADQDFQHDAYPQAMQALAPFVPQALTTYNFRLSDGSSGVECAVKMARRARGRGRVLTFDGIYLGQNTQSLHLRGWGSRRTEVLVGSHEDVVFAPLPRPQFELDFEHSPAENGAAACELIERMHDTLACVLIDPLMISSGVTMGRGMAQLVHRVIACAHRFDVPVILDECQTFGWVPDGTLARHFGFDADLLVLGKGVGGGMPLSVCISKPRYDGLEWGDADYTNGGTLAAMAGLLATCELLNEAQTRERVAQLESVIDGWAAEMGARLGPRIATRGIGLIRAIQLRGLADEDEARAAAVALVARCLERGLIVRKHTDCITLKPSLTTDPAELRDALVTLGHELINQLEAQ
ncbi:aminotransferase class III-fold pyridoxal phosphate-dependent enzyme [Roseateles sp. BYS96W]|uniref:Aminotransferase class III-fold pyridoxal phosphate-dependent enzyme n=1 Tax=Pelomonas nitida TaxID=3299027 RepID=A0ABW7GCL9_9BURK